MQGAVTAIGAYNGMPAFEYEIRDDAGNVLGVDFVIVHPHDGETWDDLAAFTEQWLKRRAMKWELSRDGRRETRLGGKRLAEYAKASTAPRLSGARPTAKHQTTSTVTKAEADSWYAEATISDAEEAVADAN